MGSAMFLSFFKEHAVEVWGGRIDRLFKRAFKFGYCNELFSIENIIALKGKKLCDKITDSL